MKRRNVSTFRAAGWYLQWNGVLPVDFTVKEMKEGVAVGATSR
jgi:hypothetical protein